MKAETVLTAVSFALRLLMVLYSELQDPKTQLKLTDIDYQVFTDAASYLAQGGSPYQRSTYRYTPLLAGLLIPNIHLHHTWGKLIFITCDVGAGLLILTLLRLRGWNPQTSLRASCLWLLNPLCMGVSSRGSAEPVLAVLVLGFLLCMEAGRLGVAAFLYGLSVHMKIYPVLYALPVALALRSDHRGFLWTFLNRRLLTFAGISGGVFLGLTATFFYLFGWDFLQETYLYHVSRTDIRHNFSPYFYMLYLTADSAWNRVLGVAAFLPQVFLLLPAAWSFHGDLPFACFLTTAIFVSFNKVCTSQYFLWYLCLLPVVLPQLRLSVRRGLVLLLLWFVGQGFWLLPAYFLEFEAFNTFCFVWFAGLVFLLINCLLLTQILVHYRPAGRAKSE